MYKKSYLLPILLGLITVVFVSCDRDYNELGSNIVGDNHFGFTRDTVKTIKAYNQKLGPVASNNLAVNPLGFYENPAFGNTQANFVTQVELAVTAPVFNNIYKDSLYQNLPVVDSVVVEIPYFVDKTQTSLPDGNGKRTYVLDSIYGVNDSKFKLNVFQSNYYLRNLDPDLNLADIQSYYTDQNADIDNNKTVWLNDSPDVDENSQFYFDKREHALKSKNSKGEDVVTRTAPSMRLHLNKEVFDNLILKAPSGQLASNNAFKNYFRGLYFKTESLGNPGNMAMINFKGGKVTMYYQEDLKTGTGDAATYGRVNKTFVMNLTGNTISLLNNSNEKTDYLTAINNPSQEASRLYLKGGEGAVTVIDLFGSADLYGYKKMTDGNGNAIDEKGQVILLDQNGNPKSGYFVYERTSSPNGVVDELDDLRYPKFTELNNTEFYSKEKKLLINDASLVFYIDRSAMSKTDEPQRIYLYDLTNNTVLADYVLDATSNNVNPKNNKGIFGGIIELKTEEDGYGKRGSQYKIRITNHIRNLLGNIDLVNVRLGLSVTENINNIGFSKVKTPNSNFGKVPAMSVMNPLGTVLYGTNIPEGDTNYGKRLKLEIDYTKPN